MKKILILFSFSILLFSCSNKAIHKLNKPEKEKGIFHLLKLTANNLSEDVNIISTHNDELILLLYGKLEREFPKVLVQESFEIDSIGSIKKIEIKDKIETYENLIAVLIEVDTKQSLQQIEPIIRLNTEKLLVAFQNDNIRVIKELLGDDDVLHISKISYKNFEEKGIRIQGIHLFDAFDYFLGIE